MNTIVIDMPHVLLGDSLAVELEGKVSKSHYPNRGHILMNLRDLTLYFRKQSCAWFCTNCYAVFIVLKNKNFRFQRLILSIVSRFFSLLIVHVVYVSCDYATIALEHHFVSPC